MLESQPLRRVLVIGLVSELGASEAIAGARGDRPYWEAVDSGCSLDAQAVAHGLSQTRLPHLLFHTGDDFSCEVDSARLLHKHSPCVNHSCRVASSVAGCPPTGVC